MFRLTPIHLNDRFNPSRPHGVNNLTILVQHGIPAIPLPKTLRFQIRDEGLEDKGSSSAFFLQLDDKGQFHLSDRGSVAIPNPLRGLWPAVYRGRRPV